MKKIAESPVPGFDSFIWEDEDDNAMPKLIKADEMYDDGTMMMGGQHVRFEPLRGEDSAVGEATGHVFKAYRVASVKKAAMTPEQMQEEIVYIAGMLENGGTPEVSLANIPSYLRVQMVNADKLNATVLSRALGQVAQGLEAGGSTDQAAEDFRGWMGMTEGGPTFGSKTAEIQVYDNGGQTADRYTVVIDGSVYTMSENAMAPNGVNMYAGEISEGIRPESGDAEISVNELPDEVKRAIEMRKQGSVQKMASIKLAGESFDLVVVDNRVMGPGADESTEITGGVWEELATLIGQVKPSYTGNMFEDEQGNDVEDQGGDAVEEIVRAYCQGHGYTYRRSGNRFIVEINSIEKASKYVWEDEFHVGDIVSLTDGGQARIVSVNDDGSYTASSGGNPITLTREQIQQKVSRKIADLGFGPEKQYNVSNEQAAYQLVINALHMWEENPSPETWEAMEPLLLEAKGMVTDSQAVDYALIDGERVATGQSTLDMGVILDKLLAMWDGRSRIGARKRASGEYLYEPNPAESWISSTSINTDRIPASGRVRVIPPPPNVPNPPKNLVYVENAETGEFIGLVNRGSLTKVGGNAEDRGTTEESVDPKQLGMGIEVEHEHHDDCPGVSDEDLATEISLDHLSELPDYYDRLKRMEDEGKAKGAFLVSDPYQGERGGKWRVLDDQDDVIDEANSAEEAEQLKGQYERGERQVNKSFVEDQYKGAAADWESNLDPYTPPSKQRNCELCQKPAGEFTDKAWESRLHLCDNCLHEGMGEAKIMDLTASKVASDFYSMVSNLFGVVQNRFRDVGTGFDWMATESNARLAWMDNRMNETVILGVDPGSWYLKLDNASPDYAHMMTGGYGMPTVDELVVGAEDIYNLWIQDHGSDIGSMGESFMSPDHRPTDDPGKMLASLGSIASPFKFAEQVDEELSPLHRFYQDRNIQGDPQRIIVSDGISKVYEVMGTMSDFIRVNGIQFERIESTRYAGVDDHVDRGKLYLKVDVAAGGPIARRAVLSIVLTIKEGEIADTAEFIDASHKHRLLNKAGLKAYLNLQDTPRMMRAPDVERAQIDRTLLPPTPSKSLFRGRGGVDA